MGKKKQKKQSQKKAGKGLAAKEKNKQRVEALKEERRLLELQVADLQRRLEETTQSRRSPAPPAEQPTPEISGELPGKKSALQEKIDWERYSYLHDRYEVYIEQGVKKEGARKMANEDLMAKFGKTAGYTDHQLECIFL